MAEPGLMCIHWPDGSCTLVAPGTDWLEAARAAGIAIPTGCLGGSCGACEITVDGETFRACISVVAPSSSGECTVELWGDPAW